MNNQSDKVPHDDRIMALEAFEHVPNQHVDRYLELGQMIDDEVRDKEPGMLVHALTQHSRNEQETVFRWLEVFENSQALEAHLDSDHVAAHIAKISDGILTGKIDLIIYADWDQPTRDYWQQRFTGVNFSYASVNSGFYRQR